MENRCAVIKFRNLGDTSATTVPRYIFVATQIVSSHVTHSRKQLGEEPLRTNHAGPDPNPQRISLNPNQKPLGDRSAPLCAPLEKLLLEGLAYIRWMPSRCIENQ